jgi:hypothetical protein
MNAEIATVNGGPGGQIEANLAVAVRQGRIDANDVAHFRAEYDKKPYELVTQRLLKKPPMRVAKPGVRGASFSEAQELDYLIRTHAIHPADIYGGYSRSVV